MQRETKTIGIKGKDVKLKTYLTGREIREIQMAAFGGNLDVETDKDGKSVIKGLDPSKISKIEDIQISTVIVAFGEETNPDKILNLVLDLHSTDYTHVLEEVRKVIDDKAFEEKKSK